MVLYQLNLIYFSYFLFSFVYDEKLGLALDEEDLKREQTLEKGKRDIILMYVNAVGSSGKKNLIPASHKRQNLCGFSFLMLHFNIYFDGRRE